MSLKTWLMIVLPVGLAIGLMVGLASAQTGQPTPWPHFKQHPQGWVPSCPAGKALIRHYPAPDCFWGTRLLNQKPTQGDMECITAAQAKQLPACPAE
jgi:hypothetical protein